MNVDRLSALLRLSSDIDVVGDVTVGVAHPADLVAWTHLLDQPRVGAWRATDSGHRFVQVSATSDRAPIHGQISAILDCAHHPSFWAALLEGTDLEPGQTRGISVRALADAWVTAETTPPAPPASRP
jgi:hypothetical protein